jgi:predicted DNA-binding transcriptional regulator YafY
MAINKYALIRYQTLDKCFRNTGRNYYFEDLLDSCNKALFEHDPDSEGIKRRQLFDDITFMESEAGYGVELDKIRDGKKFIYRYVDVNFSINNQPLNETEANQLKSAIQVLSRFKGLPQFEWVSEISTKISSGLELESGQADIIGFDSNEYLKGINFLGDLFNAVHYKKVLKISYQSFKREQPADYEIHPYYLKQYNNRWFLLGHNTEVKRLTILALDRIVSFVEIKGKYIKNKDIDFNEYFEDIIGVTKPEEVDVVKIELWFSKEEAPYVLTKPLHGSQRKIKNDSEGLIISIEVIPNYELEKLILSFGERVQVKGPKSFINSIKSRLKKASASYNS